MKEEVRLDAADIQQATGLPVFDFITFTRFIHASVVQKPYAGFL